MNYSDQGTYMCKAAAKSVRDRRCRNKAVEDGFCLNPHQQGVLMAEPAKVVLVSLWFSKPQLIRACERMFSIIDRKADKTRERYALEADLVRSSFNLCRMPGGKLLQGNGLSVFGPEALSRVVGLRSLACGLEEAGYVIDGVPHCERTKAGEGSGREVGMYLIVRFRDATLNEEAYPCMSEDMSGPQARFVDVLLGEHEWQRGMVFDNMPRHYVHHEGYTLSFHPVEEMPQPGKSVLVRMLNPLMEDLVELPADLVEKAVCFSTSTVNLRVPHERPYAHGKTRITWNRGHWACYPVGIR